MGYSRITPELKKAIAKYEKFFGEDYPLDYLDDRENPDVHIKRIEDCLASGNPIPRSEYEHLLGCLM
jgi:hypothetical protein